MFTLKIENVLQVQTIFQAFLHVFLYLSFFAPGK
jgi:hypothetical protein